MRATKNIHRRLKGGGLEGLEPPQYLERGGPAPPNFYCLLLTPQKESKLILLVLMKLSRVLTYLQATMMEKRLNNCLVLHVHKCITNKCDLVEIAKEFVMVNDE